MKFKIARKADWFSNPEIAGHCHAKDNVALVEDIITKHAKTRLAKKVAAYAQPDSDSWHRWCNVTKKEVSLLRWVLRRIDNAVRCVGGLTTVLYGMRSRSGLLKDNLDHILEHLTYMHDADAYYKIYQQSYVFLGLPPSDCQKRFEKYHTELADKKTFNL